ncbi:hypothetical protein J632_01953 [Acinetobacter baumannii 1195185_11]|nr:hypothetical protein ACIN3137_A2316 [Acinetobacter baumannii OIFC137]EJG26565.1 hypothetical protein ACIN5109_0795 [Acinetobacter baumannii OIFC109]EKL52003.1 hypothetical protein ACINNAV13_3537 [Acinetobacter baumannii Naval-13]EKP64065.1 hypothetical protein ACINWCA694_3414 [Acinetobacter baumannii WC-A-694]EXD83321.1 hypothetical protein J486_0721 [Acinetobacter baumannii 947299]EYT30707.1 hypothetical protein J632_01953 [Acinetobacter baumannii 1195185_11]
MTVFQGNKNFRQKKSSIATVQHMLLINWDKLLTAYIIVVLDNP